MGTQVQPPYLCLGMSVSGIHDHLRHSCRPLMGTKPTSLRSERGTGERVSSAGEASIE